MVELLRGGPGWELRPPRDYLADLVDAYLDEAEKQNEDRQEKDGW